jgi:Predicted acyltransferases
MQPRITHLDGMRGLAILLVIAYHAYARWPELLPYAATTQHIPLLAFGWVGVQLFFMISGFVIFMTLDKSPAISASLKTLAAPVSGNADSQSAAVRCRRLFSGVVADDTGKPQPAARSDIY